MRNPRRAYSFVEVMLAVLIIAAAMVPILTMFMQQTQVAHFNKFHLLARYRARQVAEGLGALEYDALEALAGTATYGLPLAEVQGLKGLPLLIPPPTAELQAVAGGGALPPHLEHFAETLSLFQLAAYFEEIDDKGFARIAVYVTWRVPGEPLTGDPHLLRFTRFVSRRENSLFQRRRIER